MDDKDMVSVFLSTAFACISYAIMIISIREGNTVLIFVTNLIYIFPKLIQSLHKVQTSVLSKFEFWLHLLSAVFGSVCVASGIVGLYLLLSSNTTIITNTVGKFIIGVFSSGFIMQDLYYFALEIIKHYNLNNEILKHMNNSEVK